MFFVFSGYLDTIFAGYINRIYYFVCAVWDTVLTSYHTSSWMMLWKIHPHWIPKLRLPSSKFARMPTLAVPRWLSARCISFSFQCLKNLLFCTPRLPCRKFSFLFGVVFYWGHNGRCIEQVLESELHMPNNKYMWDRWAAYNISQSKQTVISWLIHCWTSLSISNDGHVVRSHASRAFS